jgi:phosphoribosylformylglycinamidine (FGAM) synthase-like amidotransferase family enzyme
VVFRYVSPGGASPAGNGAARQGSLDDDDANPNGSLAAIAGICNRERNVVGLMPHPERAVESALGSPDGLVILRSMVESLSRRAAVPA